jgi:hypothetical protein
LTLQINEPRGLETFGPKNPQIVELRLEMKRSDKKIMAWYNALADKYKSEKQN